MVGGFGMGLGWVWDGRRRECITRKYDGQGLLMTSQAVIE